jgi:hypothetical protein
MWNLNGGLGARTVVRGVGALHGKGIYPSISAPGALRSEIDAAVAGNLPVRRCVSAPRGIHRLIASDRRDLAGYGWATNI